MEARPPFSKSGHLPKGGLVLQPSRVLSLFVFFLHLSVFVIVWLAQSPAIFLFSSFILLMLSNGFWFVRHWSMSPFVLTWSNTHAQTGSSGEDENIEGSIEPVRLQGIEEDLLNPAIARLEWFHFELMIWSLPVQSELLAKTLAVSGDSGQQGRSIYIQRMCAFVWAVMPAHSFTWRLILWRRSHDSEFWRRLCLRVHLLG